TGLDKQQNERPRVSLPPRDNPSNVSKISHLDKFFGRMKATSITTDVLRSYIARRRKSVGVGTWDGKKRTRTGVRIHDCRASAAINLLASAVDEGLVLKIGGWKTRAMLDRYNVADPTRLAAAMKKGGKMVVDMMAAPKLTACTARWSKRLTRDPFNVETTGSNPVR